MKSRQDAISIINQQSDRLLVLVGPCSIHDPDTALEYAIRLRQLAEQFESELCIVMRAYLENAPTDVGWKGLINDPHIDGSSQVNKGLRVARQLFLDITETGLPLVTETLDTNLPEYLADLISVSAIGAQATESLPHRELASGLPFPVGFKNATNGNIQGAIDAIAVAGEKHHYIGVTKDGMSAIVSTTGNRNCFLVLHGGTLGPSYDPQNVGGALKRLRESDRQPVILVDCSQGMSCETFPGRSETFLRHLGNRADHSGEFRKDHQKQPLVVKNVAEQIRSGEAGIIGVMIKSNIHEGRQDVTREGVAGLKKGVSITEDCIGWEMTCQLLGELAAAVQVREKLKRSSYLNRGTVPETP